MDQRHACKLCHKSFPCGRSLGGHMRSHLMNGENNIETGYGLRGNPKKSWRVSDDTDKLCRECGRGFMSWKALFGHIKCHSQDSGDSHHSDQTVDQREQEEVAMCLMMLSRDHNNNNSTKRHKFECTTCNKSFHSYQALGGHRASHKKMKASNHTIIHHHRMESKHECPICLKVFASGQALGGHKRSHLMGTQPTIVIQHHPLPQIRDFLDLNLPAPSPDEQDISTSSVHGFKPWWVMPTTHNNHEPLVGFI